jgi:hypothetical protein
MASSSTSLNFVNSSNINLKGNTKMKPEVVKIFDELEALHNFCRIELLPFNEADLYNRNSKVWRDFEYSKKPKRAWSNDKPRFNNDKPRNNNGYNNNYRNGRQ